MTEPKPNRRWRAGDVMKAPDGREVKVIRASRDGRFLSVSHNGRTEAMLHPTGRKDP